MKSVRKTIDPNIPATLASGWIDVAGVDATTEQDIAVHIEQDEALAMQDAARFTRRVRRRLGLSQAEFSRCIEVSVDTIRNSMAALVFLEKVVCHHLSISTHPARSSQLDVPTTLMTVGASSAWSRWLRTKQASGASQTTPGNTLVGRGGEASRLPGAAVGKRIPVITSSGKSAGVF